MIHTDSIPEEGLANIAEQIGNRLSSIMDPEALAGVDIELAKTFQLWMVGAETITNSHWNAPDLNRLAQRTDRWHHQITFNGEARVIARSFFDEYLQTCELSELFVSPLAHKIQHAAFAIEHNINPERDCLIRLLVAPAYQTHALWLYDEAENASAVMVIDSPEELEGLRSAKLVHAGEFLTALSNASQVFGYTPVAR